MREDGPMLDLVIETAKYESDKYAKARVDSANPERYASHYSDFFAGYMMNIAKVESLEKQLIIAIKGKKPEVPWDTTTVMTDDIDDLLGGGYEDGDEDLLG